MKKKFLFLFIALNYFILVEAETQNVMTDDVHSLNEFTDIFDVDDDEQIEMHKHDDQEVEIEALEEFAEKPVAPSKATIVMRQMGLKVLIGYLAIRSYFETIWSNVRENAVRFKSWVLRREIQ